MINQKRLNADSLIKAFAFVISLLLCAEYFGKSLYSGSQDLENHLMLANTILKTRDFGAVPDFGSPQLSMAQYPSLSHFFAQYFFCILLPKRLGSTTSRTLGEDLGYGRCEK
jgi:hypothetical protein